MRSSDKPKHRRQANNRGIEKRFTQLNTKKTPSGNDTSEMLSRRSTKLKDKTQDVLAPTMSKTEVPSWLMETDNERKRSEYQRSLDKIEADLNKAERKYADVKDGKEV